MIIIQEIFDAGDRGNIVKQLCVLFGAICLSVATPVFAETKIVSWNAQAELTESLEERVEDFRDFASVVNPDVIILVEMNGEQSVSAFAESLGWNDYYSVTSDLSNLSTNVFFALELAVISKIPIIGATEYDTRVDGVHDVLRNGVSFGFVVEEKLVSDGIPNFGNPLSSTDRGTIRVDLSNGLSIFPVHLKSNRVSKCSTPKQAITTIKENGFVFSDTLRSQLEAAYDLGFPAATKQRLGNAEKRERVIAAIVREAEKAVDEGRTTIIGGDFNTAFEEGKVGKSPSDCQLMDFGCKKAPFPANACVGGDGFDDTLGILENALVGPTKWSILSRNMERTYDDTAFANKAIDHIAVPMDQASKFTEAKRIDALFGSDHYPIFTVMKSN